MVRLALSYLMEDPCSEGEPFCRRNFVKLQQSFFQPSPAWPVDVFRIAVGLLSFAYFIHTYLETGDISSPGGLIDHAYSARMFWFTQPNLFQLGLSAAQMRAVFLAASLASWALILGYRVKFFALVLYLTAVSAQRWNFLVMFVDDAIVHLLLFWLLLLPVGETLVFSEWLADRENAWIRWKHKQVPGVAVRCFLWNFALIYLVAGLWKWTSPMWLDGSALYAVLKLPIAYTPDFWNVAQLPGLRILNYLVLVIEPALPIMILLPVHHRVRYALLVVLVAFHLGMLGTLRIPFANIACIAAAIIVFREEIAGRVKGGAAIRAGNVEPRKLGWNGSFAMVFVTMLTLAMLSSVTLPQWRQPAREHANANTNSSTRLVSVADGIGPVQVAIYLPLWEIGIAQQYQLFNWIDERNYEIRYEILEMSAGTARRIDPSEVFPRSTRSVLLQSYMMGITWAHVPLDEQPELRRSLYKRFAQRYCKSHIGANIAVYSIVTRIVPFHQEQGPSTRALMMGFDCESGGARIRALNLEL
jgi:hypothetical protein